MIRGTSQLGACFLVRFRCSRLLSSSRTWPDADESAISNLREACGPKLNIIVNGVKLNEIESVLGDLPKKRTKFRKKLKSIFKFQFLSKNQI